MTGAVALRGNRFEHLRAETLNRLANVQKEHGQAVAAQMALDLFGDVIIGQRETGMRVSQRGLMVTMYTAEQDEELGIERADIYATG